MPAYTLSVDPDRSQSYKKYWSKNFRAGLRLLVEHFPELRQLLAIKDPARTPRTPEGLLNMLKHLHATKQLPAGVNMELTSSRPVERTPSGPLFGSVLIPGMSKTLITIFFKDRLTVGIEFSNKNSPNDAMFSYKAVQELPPVVVHAEGMLVLEETVVR